MHHSAQYHGECTPNSVFDDPMDIDEEKPRTNDVTNQAECKKKGPPNTSKIDCEGEQGKVEKLETEDETNQAGRKKECPSRTKRKEMLIKEIATLKRKQIAKLERKLETRQKEQQKQEFIKRKQIELLEKDIMQKKLALQEKHKHKEKRVIQEERKPIVSGGHIQPKREKKDKSRILSEYARVTAELERKKEEAAQRQEIQKELAALTLDNTARVTILTIFQMELPVLSITDREKKLMCTLRDVVYRFSKTHFIQQVRECREISTAYHQSVERKTGNCLLFLAIISRFIIAQEQNTEFAVFLISKGKWLLEEIFKMVECSEVVVTLLSCALRNEAVRKDFEAFLVNIFQKEDEKIFYPALEILNISIDERLLTGATDDADRLFGLIGHPQMIAAVEKQLVKTDDTIKRGLLLTYLKIVLKVLTLPNLQTEGYKASISLLSTIFCSEGFGDVLWSNHDKKQLKLSLDICFLLASLAGGKLEFTLDKINNKLRIVLKCISLIRKGEENSFSASWAMFLLISFVKRLQKNDITLILKLLYGHEKNIHVRATIDFIECKNVESVVEFSRQKREELKEVAEKEEIRESREMREPEPIHTEARGVSIECDHRPPNDQNNFITSSFAICAQFVIDMAGNARKIFGF